MLETLAVRAVTHQLSVRRLFHWMHRNKRLQPTDGKTTPVVQMSEKNKFPLRSSPIPPWSYSQMSEYCMLVFSSMILTVTFWITKCSSHTFFHYTIIFDGILLTEWNGYAFSLPLEILSNFWNNYSLIPDIDNKKEALSFWTLTVEFCQQVRLQLVDIKSYNNYG